MVSPAMPAPRITALRFCPLMDFSTGTVAPALAGIMPNAPAIPNTAAVLPVAASRWRNSRRETGFVTLYPLYTAHVEHGIPGLHLRTITAAYRFPLPAKIMADYDQGTAGSPRKSILKTSPSSATSRTHSASSRLDLSINLISTHFRILAVFRYSKRNNP